MIAQIGTRDAAGSADSIASELSPWLLKLPNIITGVADSAANIQAAFRRAGAQSGHQFEVNRRREHWAQLLLGELVQNIPWWSKTVTKVHQVCRFVRRKKRVCSKIQARSSDLCGPPCTDPRACSDVFDDSQLNCCDLCHWPAPPARPSPEAGDETWLLPTDPTELCHARPSGRARWPTTNVCSCQRSPII